MAAASRSMPSAVACSSRRATISRVSPNDSGPSSRISALLAACNAWMSRSVAASPSSVRQVHTIRTRPSRTLRSARLRSVRDSGSLHCTSSTRRTSGASCATASMRSIRASASAVGDPGWMGASPVLLDGRRACRASAEPALIPAAPGRSSSDRTRAATTPRGRDRSTSRAAASATTAPSNAVRLRTSAARRDLPMPAGPCSETRRGAARHHGAPQPGQRCELPGASHELEREPCVVAAHLSPQRAQGVFQLREALRVGLVDGRPQTVKGLLGLVLAPQRKQGARACLVHGLAERPHLEGTVQPGQALLPLGHVGRCFQSLAEPPFPTSPELVGPGIPTWGVGQGQPAERTPRHPRQASSR